jgi:ParB family chromosome partitioning protein
MAEFRNIPTAQIDEPPIPVRAAMDQRALEELAEDIKLNGVIEPIIVTPVDGRYEIWAGHRRFLASRMAYLEEIPAIIRTRDELPSEAVMLSENLCREDLTPAEVGWFVLELVDRYQLSLEDLCRRVRRSAEWIQERVDLVQKDAEVAKASAERKIVFAVAKELLRCPDEAHRRYLLELAIQHGCTARTIRYQVDQFKQAQQASITAPPPPTALPDTTPPPDIRPQCVACGLRDNEANMVMKAWHWHEWNAFKKFLRDSGFDIHD